MKKITLLFLSIIALISTTTAQNYKKVFYNDVISENIDYKVTITDVVATPTGLKFKLTIENKSKNYIIYSPNESVFKIKEKELKPNEKPIIIRPADSDYRVIDLAGADYMIASDFDFVLNGISSTPEKAGSINAADIKLPMKDSEFARGGFKFTVTKFVNDEKHVDVKFNVRYEGDKVGIYEPRNVNMMFKNKKENLNYFANKLPMVLFKDNEHELGIAWKDIPPSVGSTAEDEMTVVWKEAFMEVTPEKQPSKQIHISFDKERTDNPKNKK